MEITVIEGTEGVSHVKLAGRMDPHGTNTIRDRFRAATVERGRGAVVDLSDVTFITSVGIGLIVDCADTVRRAGHAFVLVAPTGHVDEVFRKTGIYTIVESAANLDEALTLTKNPPA